MKIEYTKRDNYIVMASVDNQKLLGFFVADKNSERLSDKIFQTAMAAIEHGDEISKKGLLND